MSDELLSSFVFKFNLRRYTQASKWWSDTADVAGADTLDDAARELP